MERIGAPWASISKGAFVARVMADQHYNRQTPGAASWTRPGYNLVLFAQFPAGRALWCWWRPAWNSGIPGTERKDRFRVLECTLFRVEGRVPLASSLIRAAVAYLAGPCPELRRDAAGPIVAGITGVAAAATARRRSRRHEPGHCYRMAGWLPFQKRQGRADTWLWTPLPSGAADERRQLLLLQRGDTE